MRNPLGGKNGVGRAQILTRKSAIGRRLASGSEVYGQSSPDTALGRGGVLLTEGPPQVNLFTSTYLPSMLWSLRALELQDST